MPPRCRWLPGRARAPSWAATRAASSHVGRCARHCELDGAKTFYTSCTWNGVTCQALTTRMDKRNICKCGDGVCQPTETCGEKNDYLRCKEDCDTCG